MSVNEYILSKNGLFGRATGGKVTQLMTLRRLREVIQTKFTTAHVAVSNGHYIVALNIPWWSGLMLLWKKRNMEIVTLQWLRTLDPAAESVKILRKSKNLEKEQVALS